MDDLLARLIAERNRPMARFGPAEKVDPANPPPDPDAAAHREVLEQLTTKWRQA